RGDCRKAGVRIADRGAAAEGHPLGVAGGGVGMNREESTGFGGLPVHLAYHINRVCDRHEAAWRAGRRPRIEDARAHEHGAARAGWRRGLLAAELGAGRQVGEVPDRREYLERFPDEAAAIEAAFDLVAMRPSSGPGATSIGGEAPETADLDGSPDDGIPAGP